jgi:enterochelin esterase-like enzyme
MTEPRKPVGASTAARLLPLSLLAAGTLLAQPPGADTESHAGTLERIKVHGTSLEGNLEGDDPTRDVVVYLPPSYSETPARRYPVVYFLHGYTVGAEAYVRFLGLPNTADAAIANGGREMIIVLPDAYTVYSGSMYSSSPTTGDWEGYVAHDLVDYVDEHYRTISNRQSRGLAGHSMGGYGTMRIGMKHPETFSSLYAMSACCLMNDPARGGDAVLRARAARNAEGNESSAGRQAAQGGFANALSAQAAAWAPNPKNPPQYFDLPFKDGELQPLIYAKWLANSPLVMVDQYVPSLNRYRAIAVDVGDADPLGADNVKLDAELTRLRIPHTFEQYEGTHTSRVMERFEMKVLPFFSRQLEFEGRSPD